jgi:hypothetical protein
MDLGLIWERIDQYSMKINFDFCPKSNFQNLINSQSNLAKFDLISKIAGIGELLESQGKNKINLSINFDFIIYFKI